MRARVKRSALLALVGAVLVSVGTVSPGQAAAVPGASLQNTVFVCGRGLQPPPCEAQPVQLEFSDNHDLVAEALVWTDWGKASATASGDITVNWTGTPTTQPGTVTLYDLQTCRGGRTYRSGRVSWPGESVVVHFDCRRLPGPDRSVLFHSSDRSLGCALSWDPKYGSWVRCDVDRATYTTPLTAACKDLDQGDSLSLGKKVSSTCHGDTVLRAGAVLPHGQSLRVGDIRCSMAAGASDADVISCRNLVSGHGFRMSRASYKTW